MLKASACARASPSCAVLCHVCMFRIDLWEFCHSRYIFLVVMCKAWHVLAPARHYSERCPSREFGSGPQTKEDEHQDEHSKTDILSFFFFPNPPLLCMNCYSLFLVGCSLSPSTSHAHKETSAGVSHKQSGPLSMKHVAGPERQIWSHVQAFFNIQAANMKCALYTADNTVTHEMHVNVSHHHPPIVLSCVLPAQYGGVVQHTLLHIAHHIRSVVFLCCV